MKFITKTIVAVCAVCWGVHGAADTRDEGLQPVSKQVIYPVVDTADAGKVRWVEELLTRVPPLKHDLGERWPLMLWRVLGAEQITQEVIQALLDRGLVPAVALTESAIEAALVIQKSGAPVILTEGKGAQWPGRAWPYNLIQDESRWAYQYPANATVPEQWRTSPVPTLFAGWSLAAERIKNSLRLFKKRGVQVDAVWLDYEGEPRFADYRAALYSTNGAQYLPATALATREHFARYTRQLWTQLLSAYVAGPIREVYPKVSVTNWAATHSLPEFPVLRWNNEPVPTLGPTLFTATNPIAYGVDTAFLSLNGNASIESQQQVDRLYTSILLRHLSADRYATQIITPESEAIVWVARWVPDQPNTKTPMMSRPAYREALRHLWLRGANAMQIFSPVRKGFSGLAIQEVEDAAAVFDEMLTYRELMERGEVLNFRYELTEDMPILWSGMRFQDEAVVRVVSLRPTPQKITISPWPGAQIKLRATPSGVTYKLSHEPSKSSIKATMMK